MILFNQSSDSAQIWRHHGVQLDANVSSRASRGTVVLIRYCQVCMSPEINNENNSICYPSAMLTARFISSE